MKDSEEGLCAIARLRRIADEDERNGRPKSAKALMDVALAMECVDRHILVRTQVRDQDV